MADAADRVFKRLQFDSDSAFVWPRIDYTDSRVNIGYWQNPNFDITPPVASSRVNRLRAYESMYRGDYTPLGLPNGEGSVHASEFSQVADAYAALMLAFPPQFDPPLPDDFDMAELVTVLIGVIVDMTRYGFGLLYAEPQRGNQRGRLRRLDPIYWHPDYDSDDQPRAAYAQVRPVLRIDGQTAINTEAAITVFWGGSELYVYAQGTSEFSMSRTGEVEAPVMRDAFPVQVCAVPPLLDGYWGTSLYDGMVPMVAELTRRASGASTILRGHEAPHIVPKRDANAGAPFPYTEDGKADIEVLAADLDDQTASNKQKFIIPPPGYDALEYLTWDGRLEASFRQREMAEDRLASITGLPSALFGVLRGGGIPSGTALRATFAGAYARMEMLKSILVPRLTAALELAGAGKHVIEWPNALDELSTVRVAMEEDDIPDDDSGDRELSGGGSAAEGDEVDSEGSGEEEEAPSESA